MKHFISLADSDKIEIFFFFFFWLPSSTLPNMARYVPGIPASGVGPESDLGHSKESELQVCAYGFHEAASVTDAWKQRRCPALVHGEGGGLHCPEPSGTGYLLSAPPRKGSSPWLSATWLCPCAFYKGLRRRPCRLGGWGGPRPRAGDCRLLSQAHTFRDVRAVLCGGPSPCVRFWVRTGWHCGHALRSSFPIPRRGRCLRTLQSTSL